MSPEERATLDVHFYSPVTTIVGVLLAQNTAEGRIQAAKWLQHLQSGAERARHTPRLIEALALEAVLKDAQGESEAALAAAQKAVALAEKAGMVRALVDRGPRMERLLRRLAARGVHEGYLAAVLAAFPASGASLEPRSVEQTVALNSLLTNREYDVLVLLASRLSNKEIATELVLSPKTIKRYTYNIYQKLGVANRRQAVAKAEALGLLELRPRGVA